MPRTIGRKSNDKKRYADQEKIEQQRDEYEHQLLLREARTNEANAKRLDQLIVKLKTNELNKAEMKEFLNLINEEAATFFNYLNSHGGVWGGITVPEGIQVVLYEIMDEEHERILKEAQKKRQHSLVAPRTFSLRADNGRAMYSNVFTRKCSERRTFMRGGTALDLYVEPGASFRGHHWRTMLKTMYADKLPSKFDLYQAHGKVDMAALVDGNMTLRGYK